MVVGACVMLVIVMAAAGVMMGICAASCLDGLFLGDVAATAAGKAVHH